MTALYLRKASLLVAPDSGPGFDLSNLHFRFQIHGATTSTLKHAELIVWNLSKDKANRVLQEFTKIQISAGYQDGPFGVIFRGQICRVSAGKENATDSFVQIVAQDGDVAKNWSATNATLSAGWTDDDRYNQAMKDFGAAGLTPGHKPPFSINAGARGCVMFGPTANEMDKIAKNQGCRWFIEDGQIHVVPNGSFIPAPVVSLGPASGLFGVPRVDLTGIAIRSLLNPDIRNGTRVQIQNDLITRINQPNVPQGGERDVIPSLQGPLDGIGTYVATCVTHTGDTRANDWYTDMIGVAVDAPGPSPGPALNSILDVA